ncbi:hypothetical protein CARUB_v10017426mg [Capsella rubella]|uniref:Uncharacterized protein n=1 Tax=Capsella rubella TaxID=81985 RepID=R0HJX8_9BRAS|nr:UPF0496 protein At3g28270 [Capsella rubella]EOA24188.1 hypothetical protein CARUB_v10017426mg [Capsella rubella]
MALSEETMSKCSGHMSAYKSACEEHPDLKSFDSSLQQRTIKVIESLTTGADTGSLSQHSIHMEVSQHLLEVSQGVANFILESENDVWKNKALKSLVQAYFENTIKTIDIFDNIRDFVGKAEMGQLYIQEAMAEFDKESPEKDAGGRKKRYEKTLKDLKKFDDIKDVFDGQVITNQFELIQKQQESLLEKLCEEAKKKIDEKQSDEAEKELDEAHHRSKFWNVVFGAGIALAAVASLAVMAVAVGVAAPFAVLAVPLLALGWVGVHHSLEKKVNDLKRHEEDGKKQEGITDSPDKGVESNKEALNTVPKLVHQLEKKIKSILEVVGDAIEDEVDEKEIKLQLSLIGKEVEKLTKEIKEVGETVDKQKKLIHEARFHVLKKINV